MDYKVIQSIRCLDNAIHRELMKYPRVSGSEDLSPLQAWTIGFILDRGGDVFQRDIEEEFEIARSTATTMLNSMEQKGYICRIPVEYDGRLKRLVLTEKALDFHHRVEDTFSDFERKLMRNMSTDEIEGFIGMINEMLQNIVRA